MEDEDLTIIKDLIDQCLLPQIELNLSSRTLRSHVRKRFVRRAMRSIVPSSISKDKTTRLGNEFEEFLQLREKISQRHRELFQQPIEPKSPNDFHRSVLMRKDYLISPLFRRWPMPSPQRFAIERSPCPDDLNGLFIDLFHRQEEERYQLKIRHQIERDKLILSYEHEVLRLYGTQRRPISFCSILKNEEIYDWRSMKEDNAVTMKSLEEWNLKYERLCDEILRRHEFEATTLNSMQRMIWRKSLSKEHPASPCDRYVPRIEIPSAAALLVVLVHRHRQDE